MNIVSDFKLFCSRAMVLFIMNVNLHVGLIDYKEYVTLKIYLSTSRTALFRV